MSKRHATLVHINPMAGITPLVGGYLKVFAEAEPEIRKRWDIELYSTTTDCPASVIIDDLVLRAPDVIGFSTYVWNIGLVRRLLGALRGILSEDVQYLIGGVEVMNGASQYVDRSWENVIVCNGEGEKTFRELLLQFDSGSSDLSNVGGITYQREGAAITTEPHPRIRDLEEIPSPYLNDVFDRRDLAIALLETNRGCPYKCEYCFWGGAVGQKINRLSSERISEEIAYMAKKRCRSVLICDANFGIFPNDPEVARELVESHERTGYPLRVTYSSAKNNPERAIEVATLFSKGGVLSSQTVSLQTMNADALKLAKRDNIDTDLYLQLQRRMNQIGVASHIELIWPLPGETLQTFKQGIDDLCKMGAQSFAVYPLVWLRNVGFEEKVDELGVVTLDEADPVGGGQIVIQTKDVPYERWVDGMVFVNSVILLYGCRGLYHTAGILNALGIESYSGLFDRFGAWMKDASKKNCIADLWHRGRRNFEEMYKDTWRGALVESALHSARKDFDEMLLQFAEVSTDLFGGEHADLLRASIEFDILSRPFAYANTPTDVEVDLRSLEIVEKDDHAMLVNCPYDFPLISQELATQGTIDVTKLNRQPRKIRIDHKRGQIFRMPYRRDEDHHHFCHQFVTEIVNHIPVYETNLHEHSGTSAP